ncbi:Thymocyte selection-associated high mobility group box protein TOX [Bagarius yarrelli]|uniref:Thymocyte selection-associated high mobility group box protein TOX n=1 Tax=Bagarius yarrelli TaxID=175774 RepID=A0A556VBF9_BAGYA|nr:Thymocyte selection-associated high mobility group box protein TOX [Bagarius yarrelli]
MQVMDLPNMATSNLSGQDGNLLGNTSLSVALAVDSAEAQQLLTWPAFPLLSVSATVKEQGEDGAILSFRTSDFTSASKKCVSTRCLGVEMQQMVNSDSRFSGRPHGDALRSRVQAGMLPQGQLPPVNQSQLSTQTGMSSNSGSNNGTHGSPSPPDSKSATPSPSSSAHEDDADESVRSGVEKRAATDVGKKPKTPKKKKKKDPNEPQKPVSAYALFFRDTQAAIKGQNPSATFGEVSKIVASMWDGLGEEQKQVYKKKTETAKKEYLKQLAAYRATLVSQSYSEPSDIKVSQASQMLGPKPPFQSHPGLYMAPPYPQQPHLPPMQPGLTRGSASRPGTTMSMSNMAATTPSPLQITPPLHQHINLQQQMGSHAMPLHSPSMAQSRRAALQSRRAALPSRTGGFTEQTGGFTEQTGGFTEQTGGFTEQTGGFTEQTGGFTEQILEFIEQFYRCIEQLYSTVAVQLLAVCL